jgi:uncharacterized protein (DUF2164 family)
MKYTILTSLSLLAQLYSFAQGNVYNNSCPELNYCNDCGETKATYTGKLTRYFEKEVDWVIMSKTSGVVIVKVLIDTTGKACAQKFYNQTTVDAQTIRDMKLNRIIAQMGKWQPAMQDGKPVNSAVMLAIYSRVQKHKIFEVGYLRDDKERKWVVSGTDGKKPITNYDDINKLSD